jgi:hypothetical protein
MQPMNRRTALRRLAAWGLAPLCLAPTAFIMEVVKEIHALKPGEFTWHPDMRSGQDFVIMTSA